MKKVLIGVAAVVVIAVAGIFIFLATFDINQYKPQIIAAAKDATGRDLKLDGDLSLSVSLTPAVSVKGLSFSNASWGSRPDMVTVDEVEASISLLPLLTGSIQIGVIELEGADILLETGPNGKPNWEFDTAAPAEETGEASSTTISVGGLDVEDIKLTYKDGADSIVLSVAEVLVAGNLNPDAPAVRGLTIKDLSFEQMADGAATSVMVESLEAEARSDSSPIEIDLDMTANGTEIEAEGTIGPIAALMAQDGPFPIKLAIEAMEQSVNIDLVADLSRAVPHVEGSISATTLDLSVLPAAEEEAASDELFTDEPLALDGLSSASADIDVSVGRLIAAGAPPLSEVTAKIVLKDGQLSINPLTAGVGGGTVSANLSLNQAGRLSLTVDGKGITGEQLAKDMDYADIIRGGATDIAINLTGQGKSSQALASSLNGKFLFDMQQSRMKNELIDLIGADILTELIGRLSPFAAQQEYTVSSCVVANFVVNNGVAKTDEGLAFVTDRMQIVSFGDINLQNERINLSIRPKAKEGLGIGVGNLSQIFKVSGPLTSPGLGVDAAGAARTGLTIGAAIATGGLSVLAQGAKERMVDTADDPCAKARTWDQAGN